MQRVRKFQVFFYDGQDYSTGVFLTAQQAFEENYIEFVDGELKPTDECSIICDYIGLTDVSGKEIYEGHIITQEAYNGEDYELSGVVEYATDGYSLRAVQGNDKVNIGSHYAMSVYSPNTQLHKGEIIGNIYQNPELLK